MAHLTSCGELDPGVVVTGKRGEGEEGRHEQGRDVPSEAWVVGPLRTGCPRVSAVGQPWNMSPGSLAFTVAWQGHKGKGWSGRKKEHPRGQNGELGFQGGWEPEPKGL